MPKSKSRRPVVKKMAANHQPELIPPLGQILSEAMLLAFEEAGMSIPTKHTRTFADSMLANSPLLRCFERDIDEMNAATQESQAVGR